MRDPAGKPGTAASTAVDEQVFLPDRADGLRLMLRRQRGPGRPFLLVHGLSSNARLWDGVMRRLAEGGHDVAAVDLRGHGRSDAPRDGYSTPAAAADLASLIRALGWQGRLAPVVAGQSWGGNVAVELVADHGGVAGLGLVDGGWIRLRQRYPDFEACWGELAPPVLDGVPASSLARRIRADKATWPSESVEAALANFAVAEDGTAQARLARRHHQAILRSLWERDPWQWYPRVAVPVRLLAAVPARDAPAIGDGPQARAAAREAAQRLADADISWYEGADHDLHAQHPRRTARDLVGLAQRVAEATATAEGRS